MLNELMKLLSSKFEPYINRQELEVLGTLFISSDEVEVSVTLSKEDVLITGKFAANLFSDGEERSIIVDLNNEKYSLTLKVITFR